MKQRFGAILCLLLGTVLIANGLGGTSDATAGNVVPSCSIAAPGTPNPTCPVGSILFSETTVGGVAPANWTVTITSTCNNPSTGTPVNMTVTVPDGGNVTSLPLFVYTDESSTTSCSYTYSESPEPNYSTSYSPTSPQPIVYNVEGSQLQVDITNTFVAPTSTTSAPSSSAPAPSSSASSSAAASQSSRDSASASAIQLSNTGPRSPVRATLWIGIAVLLLGFVMLFLGRRPQGARVRK